MKKKLLLAILAIACSVVGFSQATQLANNEGLELLGLLNNSKAIFYSQKTNQLWVSDGTAAGTKSYSSKVSITSPAVSAVINGKLLFAGSDVTNGKELWSTDGTDAGTSLVKDINPGATASAPGDRFIVMNNEVYFSAATAAAGRELWKSNGTTSGTVMVKDIVPGAAGSNQPELYKMSPAGNVVYFICNTPAAGEELWRTDGTTVGTFLLKDIKTGIPSSTPIILGEYNNKIIFSADDVLHGREPWISDGTEAGTSLIKDIATGPLSSSADNFFAFNGKMLFAAFDLTSGQELWQTDGTTAGTTLLKDIEPGNAGSIPTLFNAIKVNNKLFFSAYNSTTGLELWETDGTTNGTKLFIDIEPGEADAIPMLLPSYANGFGPNSQLFQGNKFFFGAFTIASGYELYISDGTLAGTRLVKNLDGSIGDGFPGGGYYITNNAIYFNGYDGMHTGALFKSNGTTAGTVLVADVNPGADGETMPFVIVNNALLFYGNDGNNPNEILNDLYRVDGTEVVLPVHLLSFTGSRNEGKNQLHWQVDNAVNFDRFTVERSKDGQLFSAVGSVAWNTASVAYDYTDSDLFPGQRVYYYRLKLTDRNGDARYSNTIVLNTGNTTANDFKAYKTGSNTLSVAYHLATPGASLHISDMNGRVIFTKQLNNNNGYLNISLPVSALQLLNISIRQGNHITSKRVL